MSEDFLRKADKKKVTVGYLPSNKSMYAYVHVDTCTFLQLRGISVYCK